MYVDEINHSLGYPCAINHISELPWNIAGVKSLLED